MSSMIALIPTYLVRFMIAMLPFLGLSGGQGEVDEQPAQTEFNVDLKSGSGTAPVYINEPCASCPPSC